MVRRANYRSLNPEGTRIHEKPRVWGDWPESLSSRFNPSGRVSSPLNLLAPGAPGVSFARPANARVVELVDTQVSEACA